MPNSIRTRFALLLATAVLCVATLRAPADAASLYQSTFVRFPDTTQATDDAAFSELAEIPFTVRGGGGDFEIEVVATMFLLNQGAPLYMGYEIRLAVDGVPLPDYGVSELAVGPLPSEVQTQVVQTSFRSVALGLAAGPHTLTVTYDSYDPGCRVQAGAQESSVMIRRM